MICEICIVTYFTLFNEEAIEAETEDKLLAKIVQEIEKNHCNRVVPQLFSARFT